MRSLLLIVLVLLVSSTACAEDLVLVNGVVIDGTGKMRAAANLRIKDDKIADIGIFKAALNETTLDVKGMIIAPGFVDVQGLQPASPLITQGITTTILGSDGTGPYSVEDFMLPFDDRPPVANIAMLVGHATVRRQIMGSDFKRSATANELRLMEELVSDAMKQGAFGFASNLQQEPASFSSHDERVALAKVVAKFGGIVVVRSHDATEPIAIAREAKVAVQVLDTEKSVLAEIEKARAQHVDISAEVYSFPQLAQEKPVSFERAIPRLSSAPASRFGLHDR
ncbi:MAG TPA: hypothetical protein VGK48_28530, partial [Terriglobia bacterium]